MTPMFRRPIVLAAFVAMGLLGTSAHANLNLTVSEVDTSTSTTVFTTTFSAAGLPTSRSSTGTLAPFTTGDYTVTIIGGQANQTPTISEVLSASVSVVYTGPAGNPTAHQLQIIVTGSGFTTPAPPTSLPLAISATQSL